MINRLHRDIQSRRRLWFEITKKNNIDSQSQSKYNLVQPTNMEQTNANKTILNDEDERER